jgi:hypothetical protein
MAQAKSIYPPGQTFFGNIKRNFVDVPVDKTNENAIATTEFLEAAESLTTLFGRQTLQENDIELRRLLCGANCSRSYL